MVFPLAPRYLKPTRWLRRVKRPKRTTRKLYVEQLEDRTVPSADLGALLGPGNPAPQAPPFVPGEILIGFEGEAAAAYRTQGAAAALGAAGKSLAPFGLHTPDVLLDLPAGAQGPRLVTRWLMLEGGDVLDLAARLSAQPGIAYAEPNYLWTATSTVPNDPQFSNLWGLHNTGQTVNGTAGTADADIDAPEAWDIAQGSGWTVVAVIDSGIDYTHPDLAANVWTNPGEVAGNGIDDDGNGFIDDIHGWDFVNGDGDPFDDYGHGTHVAGTIAAVGNNGDGVVGVNWNAQVMALKTLSAGGSGTTANAVAAVNYATMMRRDFGVNVRLTSNSWGGGPFSQALQDAIQASGEAGLLFVASAGNNSSDNDGSPHYPSSYPLDNVISVAATDQNDARAGFSNFGATSVDLGAPGVNIWSTASSSGSGGDPSGYRFSDGTSMATPHVAGVAALAWGLNPTASYQTVRDAILAGVDPLPALAGITTTGGRLNAFGTLQQIGMTVSGGSPGVGEIVTSRPTDFVIRFSRPYDAATVSATDLTVNGIAADSFTLTDERTVTFHYTASPVTAEGLQAMHMQAGAVWARADVGLVDPLLIAWDGAFRYDALRMQVDATTPADGSLVPLAFTSLQFHLNEAYDPASVDIDDLVLSQGKVAGITLIDADTVEYTLDGILQEGAFWFTLRAGAVTDDNGNPILAYTGTFDLDFEWLPFPAALAARDPLGSLIYTAPVSGTIGTPGDVDRFTLTLAAGQTVTVTVSPGASLRPAIELSGSSGPIGTAGAGAAGQEAVLQTVRIDQAGTYEIAVSGQNGSSGAYTVQVILNAAAEMEAHGGPANDIIGSAPSINGSFIPLGGSADRAAVIGRTEAFRSSIPDGFGYQAVAVPFTFEDITATGNVTLVNADSAEKAISSSRLNGFQFTFYGETYQGVILASNGTITFEWDRRQGNTYNGWFANDDLNGIPDVATIAPFWDDLEIVGPNAGVYWEVRGSGDDQRLIVQWHNIHLDDPNQPSDLDFEAILYERDGSIQFNYRNLDHGFGYGPTVGIKDRGTQGPNRLLLNFDRVSGRPNHWVDTGRSVRIGVGLAGTQSSDIYAFSMAAGQDADLLLTGLAGEEARLEVRDSAGTVLATGTPGAANVNHVIGEFIAPVDGTYYAVVTGGGTVEYSLVVTRGALFDLEGNNDRAAAQDVGNRSVVLGSVATLGATFVSAGSGGLSGPFDMTFGPDGNLYVANSTSMPAVLRYNGVTGDFLDIFATGALNYFRNPTFGPDGDLYVTGLGSGNGLVQRYNGATGAYLGRFASMPVWWEPRGLSFGPDGNLYVTDLYFDKILYFDGATGAYLGDFVPSGSGGLQDPWDVAFGPDATGDGVPELYVSSYQTNNVLCYDGTTGSFLGTFVPAGSGGLTRPKSLAFGPDATGDGIPELYVVSAKDILRYDGATGAFLDNYVPASELGMQKPSGLAFGPDGSLFVLGSFFVPGPEGVRRFRTPLRDYYRIDLNEGDELDLSTATPLGGLNGLDPMLRLSNAAGVLVAADDNSAADGRNAHLTFTVPVGGSGAYFIEIVPSDLTTTPTEGEYVLTVDRTPAPSPPGITMTPTSGLVTTEAGATANFTVVLDAPPTADVTIAVSSGDSTEGSVSPTGLTFTPANWNVPQTVTVTGVDDTLTDGDVAYTVTLTAASLDVAYDGATASVAITNRDDDPAGNPNAMYVWDIAHETRTKGKKKEARVVVTVRRDSNADGLATSADAVVPAASVTAVVIGPAGGTFSGTTDSTGTFRGAWFTVPTGTYLAEVTGLTHAGYTWGQNLDPTANDTDLNGNGLPDQQFSTGPSLLAAGGARQPIAAGPGLAGTLTLHQAQPLASEAIARWAATGVDVSHLAGVDIRIADLGGATLGLTVGNTVWLDDDAAGWGWFVDQTSESDSEFTQPRDQGEQGRIDLLTALMHELGHIGGHDHGAGLMAETLAPGVRLSPEVEQLAPAVPPVLGKPGGPLKFAASLVRKIRGKLSN